MRTRAIPLLAALATLAAPHLAAAQSLPSKIPPQLLQQLMPMLQGMQQSNGNITLPSDMTLPNGMKLPAGTQIPASMVGQAASAMGGSAQPAKPPAAAPATPAIPAGARGIPATPETEARIWLKPCVEKDARRQQLCNLNQQAFVKTYLRARPGHSTAINALILIYSGPEYGKTDQSDERIGMPTSHFEACAWSGAMGGTKDEPRFDRAKLPCKQILDVEMRMIGDRARKIRANFDEAALKATPALAKPATPGKS